MTGIPEMRIPPLAEIKRLNEIMANVMQPCEVIGISMNGRLVSPGRGRARARNGCARNSSCPCAIFSVTVRSELADAVLRLRERIRA